VLQQGCVGVRVLQRKIFEVCQRFTPWCLSLPRRASGKVRK
jgi:hypothetical protein